MQELIAHTHSLTDERGNLLTFSYALLTEYTDDRITHYGIGVHSSEGDSICLPGLSVDRSAVEHLLEQVALAGLSPTHLPEVVEDWLGQ